MERNIGLTGRAFEATRPPGIRILVVDDHRDSANALVRLLHAEGYEAEAAYGYVDAMSQCRAEHFDVIIADVQLRDGDGVSMLGDMEHDSRPLRAIAVSGNDEAEEVGRARQAGFEDYLVKPFPVMTLLKAIGKREN